MFWYKVWLMVYPIPDQKTVCICEDSGRGVHMVCQKHRLLSDTPTYRMDCLQPIKAVYGHKPQQMN